MEPWLDPLFDADGMRAVDRWAIEEQGAPSLELMEAAGRAVAEVVGELALDGPVRVVCGKGNNAGDGLVAARYLIEAGFEVEALLLWPAEELSDDAAANFERCDAEYVSGDLGPRLAGSGAIVDAIFGTGFAGEPREPARAAIAAIDACGAPVVACDIASGVDASSGEVGRRRRRGGLHGQLPRRQARPPDRPGEVAYGRAAGGADRDPGGRSGGAGRRHDRPGGAGIGAAPRGALDQVQLRPGDDRGRLARSDRGGADVLAGGDPGRRRLRHGGGAGRPRADLRGGPAGGDVGRLPGRRRLPRAGVAEAAAARLRARRRGRLRARPRARPRLGRAGARGGLPDRGAAGARRRRPQRLRRRAGGDRGAWSADRADSACGRARAAARARLG